MTEDANSCPKCGGQYTYKDGEMFICPECSHEWNEHSQSAEATIKVVDVNGNIVQDGDNVIIIKELKVKGSSNSIKQGTLVKNIFLVEEAGHNISCKISGFGSMNLKSEFVKKA